MCSKDGSKGTAETWAHVIMNWRCTNPRCQIAWVRCLSRFFGKFVDPCIDLYNIFFSALCIRSMCIISFVVKMELPLFLILFFLKFLVCSR